MHYIEANMNIKLYHGTSCEHSHIDLSHSKPLKDFGRGYYLTSSFKQAKAWAQRKKVSPCFVYEYKLESFDSSLNILELLNYDEQWLDYIVLNRKTDAPTDSFDIVYDRIADNRFKALNEAIENYMNKDISAQDALALIQMRNSKSDQFCFKTNKAINILKRMRVFTYRIDEKNHWMLDEEN